MSDELEEIVDNIKKSSAWIRVLFMLVFAAALYFIILPLILVLSIAQALFSILTGDSNANLRYFSATLELYISQIINFLTYNSEEKPFPFSDFPEVEDGSPAKERTEQTNGRAGSRNNGSGDSGDDTTDKVASDKSTEAKKKPAVKKAASKKKPIKKTVAKKEAASKGSESGSASKT